MKSCFLVMGFLALLAAMGSCAGPSNTALERDFGRSFYMAKSNQILDREAGGQAPVTGMDGQTAEIIMDRFRRDFERPRPQSLSVIEHESGLGKR